MSQSPDLTAQMAFEWPKNADDLRAGFIKAPSNAAVRKWLAQTGWPERRLFIWGPQAVGKTHLLHDWTHRRSGVMVRARDVDPARIEEAHAWAIDQVESGFDPVTLLHFINIARERGKILLFASRQPPTRVGVTLPDLSSRLKAITAVEIKPSEDALRVRLAIQLLAAHQLCIAQDVAEWLVRRLPRTNAAILKSVACLDAVSLQSKRALTRRFVTSVLSEFFLDDDHEHDDDTSC